jgi:hypothetical protein
MFSPGSGGPGAAMFGERGLMDVVVTPTSLKSGPGAPRMRFMINAR